MVSKNEIIIRLILSAVIGGLIGTEREASNRPAGLRTHILVSLGSTLIMLVSIEGFYDIETGLWVGDPARLAAQVVSGIGFLGAGTIMRTGDRIKGLTTAASLWVCSGIGLAIGNGYYLGGLLTAGIALVTLMSLGNFEKKVFRTKYKTLEIFSTSRSGLIGEIGTLLGKHDIDIRDISIDNNESENDEEHLILEIHFKIKISKAFNPNVFFHELYQINGVFKVKFDGIVVSYKGYE
ncbi:MAG: MgtC/SapB family protein [Tissierellia bacterium]|nr:MgtC/SapB family protein [Tissierellia bacterium]